MKTRRVFLLLAAVAMLAAQIPLCAAQDKEWLKFDRTAADVARNAQSDSIDGYLAIYIDPANWKAAAVDGDLGPFVQAQEASPSRSMACLFSADKSNAFCVYFDGSRAYGLTALKVDKGRSFSSSAVAASYKPITPDLLKKVPGKIDFKPAQITLDNGQPLRAFVVVLGE
jgi:hypothetical protein